MRMGNTLNALSLYNDPNYRYTIYHVTHIFFYYYYGVLTFMSLGPLHLFHYLDSRPLKSQVRPRRHVFLLQFPVFCFNTQALHFFQHTSSHHVSETHHFSPEKESMFLSTYCLPGMSHISCTHNSPIK